MKGNIPDPANGKSILAWALPVTQALNAMTDKVGATSRNERNRRNAAKEPWSFACTITRDANGQETERTGGWTNCRCQIGLDIDWGSADVKNVEVDWENLSDEARDQLTSGHVILGTNLCADGTYFLYVELANKLVDHDAAKIVNSADPNYSSYQTDTTAGTFMIPIGTVENGSLSSGAPHLNPVIYKYL